MMGDKKGNFKLIMLIMIISLLIAGFWNELPWLKNSIHAVLNPSAGFLINWNLNLGMLIVVFIITFLTTLIQKYATDQVALKELKKEQKIVRDEMKKYKDHPEKMMELQKKQLEFIPKTMKLSMRSFAYTGVPFILFFRWFNDYFTSIGEPVFIGFMGWFIFYLLASIIFSSILRKWMDVV
ncbi:DUF106 domain-containing protein [Candidatus Pacearchaeota archaeon]|nr:DUF106 domain-containing protein [Candidatus Pacearchaeota archaeon]